MTLVAEPIAWAKPSLGAFATAFFLFAVALTIALLAPEAAQNLDLARAVYTMAAAMALALPAIFLYALGIDRAPTRSVWRLFWTFAFLAYVVHLAASLVFLDNLYALTGMGPVAAMIDRYGVVVALLNVGITVWWAADVIAAWIGAAGRWIAVQRMVIQLLVVAAAVVAVTPAAESRIAALAYALVAAVVLGLVARYLAVAPIRDWRPSW